MSLRRFITTIIVLGGVANVANATPLNLVPTKPDIFSSAITVTYDAGSDSLSAVGFSEELVDTLLVHYPITGAQGFSITAVVDGTGTGISGSLSITGDIAGLGASSPLLTGSLTNFGFPNSGDEPLEFVFTVTGGSLATPGLYGTPGLPSQVGVILSQTGSNFVNWNTSWDNFDNILGSVADSFAIPEPASIAFLALGMSLIRRRAR